jgi:FkbM family methyltransferase
MIDGTIVEVEGVRLKLDLSTVPDREYAIGVYDRAELDFLTEHCPLAGVFVDIGANLGLYTVVLASRRPRVRVLAFEPDPRNAAKLVENVTLNGLAGVIVCPYAVAEKEATMDLMMNAAANRGGNSLVFSQAEHQGFEWRIPVPTKTLWQALMENGVERVDILKADVEGYEFPIFQKYFAEAPRSGWPRAVVLEEFGHAIGRTGGSAVELFIKSGYRLVDHSGQNFFFIWADLNLKVADDACAALQRDSLSPTGVS